MDDTEIQEKIAKLTNEIKKLQADLVILTTSKKDNPNWQYNADQIRVEVDSKKQELAYLSSLM